MDKLVEKLFVEFGDNLESIKDSSKRGNKRELAICEILEKTFNDEQKILFDELLTITSDNLYEENLASFNSGLKLGLKLLQFSNEK